MSKLTTNFVGWAKGRWRKRWSSWLVLLCRRLLLVRSALTAGQRLVGTLVLLRRGLLARAALTAGRRLLVGTLVLLRRGLLARAALTAGRRLVENELFK